LFPQTEKVENPRWGGQKKITLKDHDSISKRRGRALVKTEGKEGELSVFTTTIGMKKPLALGEKKKGDG